MLKKLLQRWNIPQYNIPYTGDTLKSQINGLERLSRKNLKILLKQLRNLRLRLALKRQLQIMALRKRIS